MNDLPCHAECHQESLSDTMGGTMLDRIGRGRCTIRSRLPSMSLSLPFQLPSELIHTRGLNPVRGRAA